MEPSSIWDPDDDEFDRWPIDELTFGQERLHTTTDAIDGQKCFNTPSNSSSNQSLQAEVLLPRVDGEQNDEFQQAVSATLTRYRQTSGSYTRFINTQQDSANIDDAQRQIQELTDPQLGEPEASDLHDELMQPFFSARYRQLPSYHCAKHMHIINHTAYQSAVSNDPVTNHVRPRLCDALATVLFNTTPKCLDDFLDPRVKVFEWRRTIHDLASGHVSAIIRRLGNDVIVGTYRNYAHLYRWTTYVRSSISYTGAWTETFAAPHPGGTTPVSSIGPVWEEFVLGEGSPLETARDPKCALFVGRCLALEVVWRRYWSFMTGVDVEIEWEVDGEVIERKRSSVQGLFEGHGKDEDEG